MKRGGKDEVVRLPDGGTVEAFYAYDGEDCWIVVRFDAGHNQVDREAPTFYTKAEAMREVRRIVREALK